VAHVNLDRFSREVMIRLISTFTLAMMSLSLYVDLGEQQAQLAEEIQGSWIAAEVFVAQPPPELQQSVKTISFSADSLATWMHVHQGTMIEVEGSYFVYPLARGDNNPRGLPGLIVVKTGAQNEGVPVDTLLSLFQVELDFDSRFPQNWGRLLKASTQDGERLLFIKQQNGEEPSGYGR
jgi:hypothetical protein